MPPPAPQSIPDAPLTRRQAIRAGIALSAIGLLLACGSKRSASLPMPVWNDSLHTNAATVEAERLRLEALRNTSLTSHTPPQITSNLLSQFQIQPRATTASMLPIPSRMHQHQARFTRITIHHDGMPPVALATNSQNRQRVRQIRNLHVNNNGWGDIGYHYVIDRNGQIWEGRPLQWQGAHVRNQNPSNLGVLCLGNFEVETPSHAQLDTLTAFVASLANHHNVKLRNIATHQELASTLCPGRNLQRKIVAARQSNGAIASRI